MPSHARSRQADKGEGRLTGCYRNLPGDPYILKSIAPKRVRHLRSEPPTVSNVRGAPRVVLQPEGRPSQSLWNSFRSVGQVPQNWGLGAPLHLRRPLRHVGAVFGEAFEDGDLDFGADA